jgi:hypothetical protein
MRRRKRIGKIVKGRRDVVIERTLVDSVGRDELTVEVQFPLFQRRGE